MNRDDLIEQIVDAPVERRSCHPRPADGGE